MLFRSAGIASNTIESETISIYPNPFTSQTTITSTKYEMQSIKIMNVLGEEIRNYELGIRNGKSVTIDMSDVAKGVYFVRIEDDGSAGSPTKKNVVNKKIIIQ